MVPPAYLVPGEVGRVALVAVAPRRHRVRPVLPVAARRPLPAVVLLQGISYCSANRMEVGSTIFHPNLGPSINLLTCIFFEIETERDKSSDKHSISQKHIL